jgi:hypothetical protein
VIFSSIIRNQISSNLSERAKKFKKGFLVRKNDSDYFDKVYSICLEQAMYANFGHFVNFLSITTSKYSCNLS